MAVGRKRAEARAPVEELVRAARTALEESGVVKVSKLGPRAQQLEVAERLLAFGFERAGAVVRKPLRAQLLEALAHGAAVPLKALKHHVGGATAKELAAATGALVGEGAALLVVRGKEPTLVAADARVVSGDALKRLEKELRGLGAAAAGALKRPRAGVLYGDVADVLDRARLLLAGATSQSASVARVLRAVDEARDAGMGLSFVPNVVRSLGAELGVAQVKAALLEAATRGLLELRPEGGLARLTAEELELCPPGPQGTRLSWVKRSEGARP